MTITPTKKTKNCTSRKDEFIASEVPIIDIIYPVKFRVDFKSFVVDSIIPPSSFVINDDGTSDDSCMKQDSLDSDINLSCLYIDKDSPL